MELLLSLLASDLNACHTSFNMILEHVASSIAGPTQGSSYSEVCPGGTGPFPSSRPGFWARNANTFGVLSLRAPPKSTVTTSAPTSFPFAHCTDQSFANNRIVPNPDDRHILHHRRFGLVELALQRVLGFHGRLHGVSRAGIGDRVPADYRGY